MVSLNMTVCVVEYLEFVEIQQQKGQRLPIAVRPLYFSFQLSVKMPGIVTAKRIQAELSKEPFSPALGQEVYMTVSIGMAQYKPKEEMKAFVHRVDQFMYQAKKNGRDRICPES